MPDLASPMQLPRAMKTLTLATILAYPLLLVACADKPAVRVPTDATGQNATTTAQPQQPKTTDRLAVSGDLVRACNLTFGDPKSAPKFDRDTSELTAEDRAVLDQVAKCVTTGPLKGNHLALVGRADPRGEQEYNMSLGGYRAAAVRSYLTNAGVDGAKIATTSRGKLDAKGSDEESWRLDRRVDVQLEKK